MDQCRFIVCPVCGDIIDLEVGYCIACGWKYSKEEYEKSLNDSEPNKAKKFAEISKRNMEKQQEPTKKLPPPSFKKI